MNAKPTHMEASARTFSMEGNLDLILRIVAGAWLRDKANPLVRSHQLCPAKVWDSGFGELLHR